MSPHLRTTIETIRARKLAFITGLFGPDPGTGVTRSTTQPSASLESRWLCDFRGCLPGDGNWCFACGRELEEGG